MKPFSKHSSIVPFPSCRILSFGLAVAGFSPLVQANNAWDGGGTAVGGLRNWSDSVNWGLNTAPTLPGTLIYAGTNGLLSNNDLSGQTVNGFTFNTGSGAFVIGGNSITLGGNTSNNSISTQTINLPIVLNALRIVGNSTTTGVINLGGVISGAGGLNLVNNGTVNITGTANTYSTVTVVTSGVLNVASLSDYGVAGSLGNRASDSSSDVGLLFRGGTLQYTGSTAQSTNRAIRIRFEGGTIDASGSDPAATLSFTAATSPLFWETSGSRTLTLTGSNTGNNTFGMAINQTGSGGVTSFTKSGSGTWVLTGANIYTGATLINDGSLRIGAGSTIGSLSPSSAITNNGNLTINRSDTVTQGINFGTISGSGSFTQEGGGTTTFNAANTYTGATSISGGTLTLGSTGSIENSSGVSLGTSGTFNVSAKTGGYAVKELTGSGNVIGALTISTGLAIGNSVGTINFSDDLTIGSTTTYRYDLIGGGNAADLGIVAGNLTLTVGSALQMFQLGSYTANDKFTLLSYSGTLFGIFTGLADDTTFTDAGGIWQINYNDITAGLNGGTVVGASYVTVTAVPEPAAVLLGGLGLIVLLRRGR